MDSQIQWEMELDSLAVLQQAAWPHAMNGSHWHIFRVAQIMERRAKLWGWDSEKRVVEDATARQSPEGERPQITPEYMKGLINALAESDLISDESAQRAQGVLDPLAVIETTAAEVEAPTESFS